MAIRYAFLLCSARAPPMVVTANRPKRRFRRLIGSPLVGYQRAGLAERIIVSVWAGGAKLHRAREDGHRLKPPARPARRTPKKTADSTKNYRKVWKRSKSIPGTNLTLCLVVLFAVGSHGS